jgi:tetratricopeptide (TPR) repeat protein
MDSLVEPAFARAPRRSRPWLRISLAGFALIGVPLAGGAAARTLFFESLPVAEQRDPAVTGSVTPRIILVPEPSPADLARERAIELRVAATKAADLDALGEAIALLEATLPEQSGTDAAATENELGLAKRLLGQGRNDAALLADAVAHYDRAVATFESAGADDEAAVVRWNLAIAMRLLGEAQRDSATLNRAADLLRQLLANSDPALDGKAAHKQLGLVLLQIGELSQDLAIFEEAMSVLEAALVGADKDGRSRIDWAETQNAYATALQAVAEREWSIGRLEAALKARRNAWVLYQSAGLETYRFYFDTRIEFLEKLIADRRAGLPGASPQAEDDVADAGAVS